MCVFKNPYTCKTSTLPNINSQKAFSSCIPSSLVGFLLWKKSWPITVHFSMQNFTRIEMFFPSFFSNEYITSLAVYVVKECHLLIDINLFKFPVVVCELFLLMLLIHLVFQQTIYVIL